MMRFKAYFLQIMVILWIFGVSPVFPQQIEYLQHDDVNRVMSEIFERHIEKKEMTQEVIKNSLRLYLEQFDPGRIYLLEKEVEPFLDPSETEVRRYLRNYKDKNFAQYEKIEDLIQKAIARQQKLRKEMMANPRPLFDDRLGAEYYDSLPRKRYAQNLGELKKWIKQDMMDYIEAQRERFGRKAVDEKKDYILERYDHMKRDWEAGYLYVDNDGKKLPQPRREHQFTLHILKALSRSLDSHTSVINKYEAYDMRSRLLKGYPGTGINFEETLDGIVVKNVQSNSPADKAGKIKKGDLLYTINGIPVQKYSFSTVMKLLEGDVGTSVTLSFKRPQGGVLYKVDLTREMIMSDQDRVDTRFVQVKGGIIGQITLHSFYKNGHGISSENDVRKAIDDLKKQGRLKGLILDLRDNSGGYLSEAVKVAGLFITNGVIVMSKYHDGEKHYYRDIDGRTYFDGPLVVLISRFTASAAEIVAQALQDYGVAVVVGDDRSFGKGSIQSQTVTGDEGSSYFKVTVGKYYTVSGKTPQVKGVVADVVVPGEYIYEDVGEKFLKSPIQSDKIEPAYQDKLADIRPEAKPWFFRYYLPTLQPKKTSWQKMIPELKSRSEKRLNLAADRGLSSDQQMKEAVKVAEDMIELHSKMNMDQVGAYE